MHFDPTEEGDGFALCTGGPDNPRSRNPVHVSCHACMLRAGVNGSLMKVDAFVKARDRYLAFLKSQGQRIQTQVRTKSVRCVACQKAVAEVPAEGWHDITPFCMGVESWLCSSCTTGTVQCSSCLVRVRVELVSHFPVWKEVAPKKWVCGFCAAAVN